MAQITPASLMDPNGPVTATLFPEQATNAITVKLQGYIDEAYADSRVVALASDSAKQNKAARAWSLYRTFDDVAVRMTAEPMAVNNGAEAGSSSYTFDQIQAMMDRALRYLKEFNDAAVVVGAVKRPINVKNVYVW